MKISDAAIRKSMISRLVKPPRAGFVSRHWPREMKLAKELLEKYPNQDFWKVVDFGIIFNSLAALKMEPSISILERKYKEFFIIPVSTKEHVELSDRKFGETLHTHSRRVFMKDLLR